MPTRCVRLKRGWSEDVHSVGSPCQKRKKNPQRCKKRVKANDPVAMNQMGTKCFSEGDPETALKYWTRAAELGDAGAHHNLSLMYLGQGVKKDVKKYFFHAEQAAIAGHPDARHNLGREELRNGRLERAREHFIIAANLGYHNSLEGLRQLYKEGYATKEDYAAALRAYQAAVDATKSAEREKAEAAKKTGEVKMSF